MTQRLVIISPCRNEERFIERTLRSVAAQTRRPDRWLIVDDGSTDASVEIVERYAAEHSWIELARRQRTGERALGPAVVHAFNYGLEQLGDDPFDFIAKMDADLEFAPTCFERIMRLFDDEKVGMASGAVYLKVNDHLARERYADYHIPGAAKFYRRACFEQIGGPRPIFGWDILDVTDARRLGWKTFSDEEIKIVHLRLQGLGYGAVRGRVVWGRCAYAVGSHPLFAIARGFYRMLERPWIVGGMAFIWGFFSSYFNKGIVRNPNPDSIRFLRREQLYRLFHGNRLPPGESDAE